MGKYLGTLTEGDLLWHIKNSDRYSLEDARYISVMEVKRNRDNEPVEADADMDDLINKAMNQNFVPVIDDKQIFIGIVTRKDIMGFCYREIISVKNG